MNPVEEAMGNPSKHDTSVDDRAWLLVVDDEPANVELLVEVLARAGYDRVHTATNARDALAVIRSFRPDLVILDLHMPEISGIDLINLLNGEIEADEFIPILVVTADVSDVARQGALEAGATDFVTKPFHIPELLLRVRNLLRTRALHQQVRARAGELETKLDEQLTERLREKEAYIEALVAAQESERERIATEIHDDTIQMLTAISIRLELLSQRIPDAEVGKGIEQIIKELGAASERLRTLLFDLRPPSLGTGGLVGALRDQLEFTIGSGRIEWAIDDHMQAVLPRPVELALFRIGQEAIANARDHAQATRIFVEVSDDGEWAQLVVRDDGRGFDVARAIETPRPGHLGVTAMHERAEAVGGSTEVASAEGRGTTVRVRIPLRSRRTPWRTSTPL